MRSIQRMTVAVVGGSGIIGRSTVAALVASDPVVKVLVRRPEAADSIRALGAKVAVGDPTDLAVLEAVLGGAFTAVLLVGNMNEPDQASNERANLIPVERAVAVARDVGVGRLVLVSPAGADARAPIEYLRARASAEQVVAGSGIEHAVVRTAVPYGVGGFWFTAFVGAASAAEPFVVGSGSQELAPAFADDLGRLIAAIDDRSDEIAGVWGFEGPDVVSADELAAAVAAPETLEHLPARPARERLEHLLERPVSIGACELLAAGSRADAPDAGTEFGVRPTGLLDGLGEVAKRAASEGLGG